MTKNKTQEVASSEANGREKKPDRRAYMRAYRERQKLALSEANGRVKKSDRRAYMHAYRPPIERLPLSFSQILEWADAHHARTGRWPTVRSGRVWKNQRENWNAISAALNKGCRGLPGGLTLAQFLAAARGRRNRKQPPRLSVRQILQWADDHRAGHGMWPVRMSGAIPNSGGESWAGVDNALSRGTRGFPGGSSLRRLLIERRGEWIRVPHKHGKALTIAQILLWVDDYFARHGRWPSSRSGRVFPERRDEMWKHVNLALIRGTRGLPGGSSLARLLAEHREREPYVHAEGGRLCQGGIRPGSAHP
jgi:hypothetical protein